MILKQTIKKVEESKTFKSFIKKHPDYYLVHCFTMVDEGEKKYIWELGYYSGKTDRMVVFETKPKIIRRAEEEAFKKQATIKKLDLSKVRISLSKALDICNNLVKDKYPKQNISKKIIILQHLDKQVYNITLVTRNFNILNIKIDSNTGEVLQENIQNILSLGKR
nr:PepSY domain-containing protein [Nanoarchaeota archaeon]